MVAEALTPQETLELNVLKTQFFGKDLFVEFTQEQEDSPEMKRMNELVQKKQNYLKSLRN